VNGDDLRKNLCYHGQWPPVSPELTGSVHTLSEESLNTRCSRRVEESCRHWSGMCY